MTTEKIVEKAKRTPATAAAVKQAVEQPQKRIYVGPASARITKYTVLESDFPPHLKELVQECPDVEKLFVPILELQATEKRITTKGTLEHRAYNNVVEFLKGAK